MAEGPPCPVCGWPLGRRVWLDILSIDDGGKFRLTCEATDDRHDGLWNGSYQINGPEHALEILHHVGRKTWADPCQVLRALWPWLMPQSLHDA